MAPPKAMVVLNLVLLLLSLCVSRIEMAEALNTAVSAANNDFTKDVYLNLAASKQENAILSPFSLHVVLGMASFGADGDTATAMMKGLRIKHSETLLKDYKGILEQLNKSSELTSANKIYVAQDAQLNPAYQKQVVENFNSEVGKVNFNQAAQAASEMNNWVSNQTNNKIKDLISPDSVSGATRLVLLNAIYFKGLWTTPFRKENTKDGPFYLDNTNSVQVPMMFLKDYFYIYSEEGDEGYMMLELPYGKKSDQQFSMHIFLPNKRDGLAALEKKLFQTKESFAEKFGNIVKSATSHEVAVTLPRFKIESEWNLNDLVKKLGMEVAFTDSADFSKMTANQERLKISEVVQKAFIEVNEEGTEAAAATACFVRCKRSLPTLPSQFVADHPFFLTVSLGKKLVLFVATVNKLSGRSGIQKEDNI